MNSTIAETITETYNFSAKKKKLKESNLLQSVQIFNKIEHLE
jgi:hypothetical protein